MDGPVELTRGERVDRVLSGKEPHLRPGDPPPVPQELEELRREHRKAIPSPLALLDPEQHAPGIDVADLEWRPAPRTDEDRRQEESVWEGRRPTRSTISRPGAKFLRGYKPRLAPYQL